MRLARLTAAALLLTPAARAGAQPRPGCGIVDLPVVTLPGGCPLPAEPAAPAPRWRTQAGYAAANVALGGVTAAVARGVGARSWRAAAGAFVAGAAGGAGIYLGKRTAAQRFDGAGLAGRQLAAVSASVVRDAGAGRPPFSRLVLPVGPVRVYVGDDARRGTVRVRVDATTIVGAVDAALQPGARFDLRGSLSAGALAFITRPPAPTVCGLTCPSVGNADATGGIKLGYALGGTLWVLDRPEALGAPPGATARTRAHEQVHVVQYDAGYTLWTLDGERRLFAALGRPGRRLGRWLDLGLHAGAIGVANQAIPYARRPWEREAHALAGSGGNAY